MVRQALGDDGRSQKFIRTISKKGFRFIADVSQLGDVETGMQSVRLDSGRAPGKETREQDLTDSRPSVAVLPFANMSGDAEQEYFSDGITEDIITALSKFRWFLHRHGYKPGIAHAGDDRDVFVS